MTGLTDGQLAELTARVRAIHGDFHSNGRPYALGLYRSIAMVVALLRKNITQDVAGAIFGVSQSTTSRRWDLLRGADRGNVGRLRTRPERGRRHRDRAG